MNFAEGRPWHCVRDRKSRYSPPLYLLLPLLAAITFAFGAMVYKRAFAEGAGIAHLAIVNNAVLGFLFAPLLLFEPKSFSVADLWMPVATALTFAAGHWLNILSLRRGDVSLATPLLGAKVIIVAAITTVIFHQPVSANRWIAASLATLGVVIMGLTDFHRGGRVGFTTATALGCAVCFALTDTMIQAWGSRFGVMGFLALVFGALAILSLGILPAFGLASLRAPRSAWLWIAVGIVLSALQAIIITGTIAIWKDAAGVNVVYATRGLWSIVLVWCAGHWLKNTERHTAGSRRMAQRFAGAALILAAVALTLQKS